MERVSRHVHSCFVFETVSFFATAGNCEEKRDELGTDEERKGIGMRSLVRVMEQDLPIAFMGNCFAGPSATSHAFLTLSVSVSSTVGGFRAGAVFLSFWLDF